MVPLKIPTKRPKGLGLGADISIKKPNSKVKNGEKDFQVLKKYSYVKVINGIYRYQTYFIYLNLNLLGALYFFHQNSFLEPLTVEIFYHTPILKYEICFAVFLLISNFHKSCSL